MVYLDRELFKNIETNCNLVEIRVFQNFFG